MIFRSWMSRQEVDELLGINQSTLRNWIRQQRVGGATAATADEGEELAQLPHEVTGLRKAKEILRHRTALRDREPHRSGPT